MSAYQCLKVQILSKNQLIKFLKNANIGKEMVIQIMQLRLKYNFFIPATALREFTWNIFAAQYIEMAKARAYGIGFSGEERDGAIFTLHKVLSTILKLLAPITPFITEHLWLTLYSKNSIHKEQLPNIENVEDMTNITQAIVEFNSKVWNEKKQNDLSLKDSIRIEIPEHLDQFRKDLIAMHNLETD